MEQIRNAGRKVSVELRKLLWDGTPLVHHVLKGPRFHMLRDKCALTGNVYRKSISVTLKYTPGKEDERNVVSMATHTWRTSCRADLGLWDRFISMKRDPVPRYGIVLEAGFQADIFPPGLPNQHHVTGSACRVPIASGIRSK